MSCIIRKAVSEDFADVYNFICELVGSPVGGIALYSNNILKMTRTNLKTDDAARLLTLLPGSYITDS